MEYLELTLTPVDVESWGANVEFVDDESGYSTKVEGQVFSDPRNAVEWFVTEYGNILTQALEDIYG